jgi:raffinose/stachyose/melibiose transport system substrate-binding protein
MKTIKLKGILAMVLVGMISLLTLAGCGGAATNNPPASTDTKGATTAESTQAKSEKPMEIRVMTCWTAGSAAYGQINKLVDEVNQSGSKVKIVHDALPSGELRTKLTVEMAAGTPPDVSWCVLNFAREFMKDNMIIDWKPVIEDPKNPEFKQWFDDKILYFAADKDGKVMMIPEEASMDGLYYNKDIFEKYGWQPPKTFDELIDIAKKAKEKGISAIVTGGKDMRFAWMASALLVRAGGLQNATELALGSAMTKWNDPQYGFVDAMKKFKQLVDAGAFPQGVLGLSQSEADQMFTRGEAAMYYEGSWKVGNFETAGSRAFIDRVGRIDFPAMADLPNGDKGINVGGIIIGYIVANGLPQEKTEACIDIVKKLASPEFNIPVMENNGWIYAGKGDYDRSKVSNLMSEVIDAYRRAPGFIPSMDAFAPPSVDLAIKQTAMPGIISGEFDVDKAVAEVQKAAEDYAKSQK